MVFRSIALLLALAPGVLFAAVPVQAAEVSRFEGLWQGALQGVRIVFHLTSTAEGTLTATMDSPDQGALGIPVDEATVAGDTLRLRLLRLGGSFEGRLDAGGVEIAGVWKQSGFELPLTLRRREKPIELDRPQVPKKPYPYREDSVVVWNRPAGMRLAGTLTMPAAGGPFPAVVLITGSGPENRDEEVFGHRPFLVLADHLTRRGIAVLRLDDRGVGGSSGSHETATSEDFASDILAAVRFLGEQPGIAPRRIGLIGHSEGGLIGPMVAARARGVAFVVLLAGPGVRGDSLLLLQNAAIRRTMGEGEEAITRQLVAMRRVLALVVAGADSATLFPEVRAMVEAQLASVPEEQRRRLGSPDSLAARGTRQYLSPWMRFFIGHDPRPTLERLRCPVLALNGGKDFQVPPRENLAAIARALERGRNRDHTEKELPGLNHLFQRCSTCTIAEYATLTETFAPAALEEISGWILERTAKAR